MMAKIVWNKGEDEAVSLVEGKKFFLVPHRAPLADKESGEGERRWWTLRYCGYDGVEEVIEMNWPCTVFIVGRNGRTVDRYHVKPSPAREEEDE